MNIYDLTKDELKNYFTSIGEKSFRADQVFKNLYKTVNIDDMTDLSKSLRERLKSDFTQYIPQIERKLTSKKDFVVKYLFKMDDGEYAEGVVMGYKHGLSMCISTQVGCRMGCKFCASTLNGLKRNLTAGEITGQILAALKDLESRISNIVLMGSGEPFDNYENVLKFIQNATHPDGLGIGARHITVSTCGLTDGIYRLSKEGLPINLSISLHAPNDGLRKQIMPVANAVAIDDLIKAANDYYTTTGRRVTYEYSLIKGVNDSENEARQLVRLLKNTGSHINLIPVNEVKEREYKTSVNTREFQKILTENGINATVRRTLGQDINASCGQLRNQYERGG
ncbi:MAG: 23S rRNA (adenine(2503)-C(2))-methyltransferase RlmN [Clostridia bacterium]|nr:23S rRNA (adenine(2503)-C(2))-methyltransferase RlmN [Clostridia bacterium]